jgi:modification target Cys-rich repeat protein
MVRNLTLFGILVVSMVLGGATARAQGLPDVKVPGMGDKKPPGLPGGAKLPGAADCGDVDATPAGAKLKAFIAASEEVDKASAKLEASVKDACRDMAKALSISDDGDTKTVCNRVAAEIKNSLKVGVKAKSAVAVKYTPAVCKVNADFTAEAAAKCEGKAKADVKVSCSGTCSGTCNGACSGACASKNAKGQCAGTCEGTCKGSCSGSCSGAADVDGSAECKASASARGNLRADCSEPKVDVAVDSKAVVDASRIARVEKALKVGLPAILSAGAKAKLVAKSVKAFVTTAKKLGGSGAALVKQLGAKAVCVSGELAGAAKVATQVNVRVNVSVQASASVSGAAGAKAQ